MYAVLSGPALWEEIQVVFSELQEEITFQRVSNSLESDVEFQKISRLAVKVLIIDFSAFPDVKALKQSVMRYKILRDSTRIIILAPGVIPGDPNMSFFFSLGILDILNPSPDDLKNILLECLKRTPSYKKGVRWFNEHVQSDLQKEQLGEINREVIKKIEFRDKIIGSVTVAFAGVRPGVGCSFLALQTAFYLNYNYRDKKVALVSFNSFSDYLSLAGFEGFLGSGFSFKDIDFFDACDVAPILSCRKYDYIVLDIGVLKTREQKLLKVSSYYAEFLRSDIQFLISGSAPWHTENMLDCLFVDRLIGNKVDSASWVLLFNFAPADVLKKLCSLDILSFAVPYFPYLFKYDESFFSFLSKILKPVLPQLNSAKKSFLSFFR